MMKIRLNLITLPLLLLTIAFLLSVNFQLYAQEKPTELKEFKVVIEKTDNTIKMTCEKGCTWTKLTYTTTTRKPQAIDEYGMTDLKKVSSRKDPELSDFLFTITKTEAGVALTGMEGTAWTELGFSLAKNNRQAINHLGMTK